MNSNIHGIGTAFQKGHRDSVIEKSVKLKRRKLGECDGVGKLKSKHWGEGRREGGREAGKAVDRKHKLPDERTHALSQDFQHLTMRTTSPIKEIKK